MVALRRPNWKLAVGIVVVDSRAGRPGFLKAILRMLLRPIEVNPLAAGGVPAGLIALFNRRRQRLGDIAAKTYVSKKSDLGLAAKTVIVSIPLGGTRSVWPSAPT
jgi:uncharacterized RDD family membrane protein YckC